MSTYVNTRAGRLVLASVLAGIAACSPKREAPSVPGTPAGQLPTPVAAVPDPQAPAAGELPPDSSAVAPHWTPEGVTGGLGLAQAELRLQSMPASTAGSICCLPPSMGSRDRERYEHLPENPVRLASEHPVSTFSVDVDTGSYANVRRFLNEGRLPPEDAVRVEELINYFAYEYAVPKDRDTPFAVTTAIAPAPWNAEKFLLQIGLRGYEVPAGPRPAANLVFLIDVSGSMMPPDKLPLLKNSLRLLTRQLGAADRVSMVVYAGAAGAVLQPTAGDRHAEIESAIERLEAGGSTNGGEGIRLAYALAHQSYIREGINRVLLATDGDFNVGTVDFQALLDLVERERDGGVSLTTLGFGTGNYNDRLLERLADVGNGNYAYVDTLNEARKVLVEQMTGTLQTIAKDVKIQVEFNPAVVAEYRLIGYQNRTLRREDFNNDRIDAGEIGSGHAVTALYELALVGGRGRLIDPLRYAARPLPAGRSEEELAYIRLRYKTAEGHSSRLLERAVRRAQVRAAAEAPQELRFAAAVAAFGERLRGGDYLGDFGYEQIADLARGARGSDPMGYRSEFLRLVALAGSLSGASGARASAGAGGN